MNFNLFKNIFGANIMSNKTISASLSEDDLGVLLRVHLLSERFLEAFISASIDKGDLYHGATKDKEKSERGYFSKLNTAKELGLPEATFEALRELNSARNEAAHQLDSDSIKIDLILALEEWANKITDHTDVDLTQHGMRTADKNGKQLNRYDYASAETPLRVKLLILYSCLIRRSLEACGLNLNDAS